MSAVTPPGLVWVDELPAPSVNPRVHPHAEWAEALRSRPGKWATLTTLPVQDTRLVSGQGSACAPYRPRGSFMTEVRNGVVHACYVGEEER